MRNKSVNLFAMISAEMLCVKATVSVSLCCCKNESIKITVVDLKWNERQRLMYESVYLGESTSYGPYQNE